VASGAAGAASGAAGVTGVCAMAGAAQNANVTPTSHETVPRITQIPIFLVLMRARRWIQVTGPQTSYGGPNAALSISQCATETND
jgi:hypothetical protein